VKSSRLNFIAGAAFAAGMSFLAAVPATASNELVPEIIGN
jgi:hypothetical protein